jgi:hypothetical protein
MGLQRHRVLLNQGDLPFEGEPGDLGSQQRCQLLLELSLLHSRPLFYQNGLTDKTRIHAAIPVSWLEMDRVLARSG